MKAAIRTHAELGADLVLAPERYVVATSEEGTPLRSFVEERSERAIPDGRGGDPSFIVLDTTHARDGVLDIAGALRDAARNPPPKSLKKRAREGDVVISRLRPYLRQVAYVHRDAFAMLGNAAGDRERSLAFSTEFYVLSPKIAGDDLAWLVPFLLSEPTQVLLASAQEGGHHPRVPRSTLLALRVPDAIVAKRARSSEKVQLALADVYRGATSLARLLRT